MTSHDVVNFIRRLMKIKKVGHTGTLDPDVAGVLPVCLGKATKIVQYLTESDKEYRGEMTFGITTDTQDASGMVTGKINAASLTVEQVSIVIERFTGEQLQIPPMVSAVKVQGKKLYEYARAGIEVTREARKVYISNLEIIETADFGTPHPRVKFAVTCSKGTYVRTLCTDIGEQTGYGAHMSFLERTRSGPFTIDRSLSLETIRSRWEQGTMADVLVPISKALGHMPEVIIYSDLADKIKSGNRIYFPGVLKYPENLQDGERVCLKGPDGECLAIASTIIDNKDQSRLHFQPVRVF